MFRNRNRMDQFTIDELNRVDQKEYNDELWVLRHSPAGRHVFAEYQTNLYLQSYHDEDDLDDPLNNILFCENQVMLRNLQTMSGDIVRHHPWSHCPLNPNRVVCPTAGRFSRLAKELGVETKKDDCGEKTMYKTILGWWVY